MRFALGIVLSVLLLTPSLNAAAADARETSMRAQVERLPPVDRDFLVKAKYAGHYSVDRLVAYSNTDGRPIATFHLPAELVRQFDGGGSAPLLVSLEGSPHVWSLHRRKGGTLDLGLSLVALTCYAPDETGPFNRFSVASDGHSLMVAAAQMYGHPAVQQRIWMNQGEGQLHIAWRLAAEQWATKNIDINGLMQLALRVPGPIEDYLMPVLQRLGPALPASDVYRVFDRIPADPAITRQILPLIARLDSDDSKVRDAAAASLKALGRPAVHACLRLDEAVLSPEQRNRLSAFYASEGWVHVADVEVARRDPVFLTGCLEDEDPAVRAAASTLLAALMLAPPANP
ncbi:MAG: hypothetical protein JWN40_4845 [Phycisphaerales bacterium]|nr:hypothetical protein [Phycisphaerales bacterium]